MIFFTADLHFSHTRIIDYCNRPFSSIEEMNNELIYRWNAIVRPKDTIFLLGDLGFGRAALDCISKLNGEIILIKGNHDYGFSTTALKRVGIADVYNRRKIQIRIPGHPIINLRHYPKYKRPGLNLCGHVHTDWLIDNGFVNVGVDMWDFAPMSLDYLKLFETKDVLTL